MGSEDDVEFEVKDLGPCEVCGGKGCDACDATGSKSIIVAKYDGCEATGGTVDQAARRVMWLVHRSREERGMANITTALDEAKMPTHEGDDELSIVDRIIVTLMVIKKVHTIVFDGDEDDASAMVLDIRQALEGPYESR